MTSPRGTLIWPDDACGSTCDMGSFVVTLAGIFLASNPSFAIGTPSNTSRRLSSTDCSPVPDGVISSAAGESATADFGAEDRLGGKDGRSSLLSVGSWLADG